MENKDEGIFGNKSKDLINKSEKLTNYQKLNIPGLIKIGDYSYVYKDQSKSNPNLFFFAAKNQFVELQ